MFNYKRGDIIFDADQTRQILQNGKITSGKKRGTAFASGNAFYIGENDGVTANGTFTVNGKVTTTPSGSSSSNSSNSADPKVFDWIEVAIDRIERAVDKLKTTATSAYKALKTKLGATYDEITKVNKELSLQQKAYNRYMQEANSVGLSADLMQKVQDGSIDISEYNDEIAELISDYQNWYIYATLYSNVY